MNELVASLDDGLRLAIKHFWKVRTLQGKKQGGDIGVQGKDRGERSAVTGGKHLDGFYVLVRKILVEAGLSDACIFAGKRTELPGWYRAEKDWDLVIVVDGVHLAPIEFKSQIGPSFGNNFNNRTEEVLGNATDIWAAFREGAFKPSERPWLGFLMLLEDCPRSQTAVRTSNSQFPVFPEFIAASYAKRYEILLTKLVRDRLYESTCLLLTTRQQGLKGLYSEPSLELNFHSFATSLLARAIAHAKMR